ncbi:hypothetical protein NE857_20555 [Nocardiopsis exhalans]|uniref:TPM domain-containing protein n=1 Tax=Nocardiopsis exhalans TaxID=163604 RepID=A0ABY5D0C8_9ACTN|nr:hypothetical protein [Nocardiopsis exhalans]USY17716.1 hypothetical protein NE857_20555 [Nocardiopsis exhalans]
MRVSVRAALAVCLAAPVFLAPSWALADSPTPAEAIAEGLRGSPVHVDPAYDSAFPEEARDRVVSLIEDSGLPVRVLLVPLVDGDTWGGDPTALAGAVHDRTGGRAHYLVMGGGSVRGTDYSDTGDENEDLRAHYGALAASYATGFDAPLAEEIELAVEFAVADDPAAAFQEAQEAYREANGIGDGTTPAPSPTPEQTEPAERTDGGEGPGWRGAWRWAAAGVVFLLLVGGYLLWTRPRQVPTLPQHAAFANADRAHREKLRGRAERELTEVGERLSALRPDNARDAADALRGALDAHAAARSVLDRADGDDLADLAGVLVLLDTAEDGMVRARDSRRGGTRRRHCYANPLHGTDTAETDWRELGGTRTVRVPLCRECAGNVRARTRLAALLVEYQGRTVPYYEVPARESVWSATGFGSLADDLVERILRGDHRGSQPR